MFGKPPANTWDFFSGRGEGASRIDRWAVRQRCASQALGGTLARDDTFWEHVEAVAAGSDPRPAARLYVLRKSSHQDAIVRLLEIGAAHADQRFARDGIRAGRGILAVTTAAGPIVYFEEGQEKANAFSLSGAQVLDIGALLIARRGAGRCLDCGEPLSETTTETPSQLRRRTKRVNYCVKCGPRVMVDMRQEQREAITTVLDDATPQILAAHPI